MQQTEARHPLPEPLPSGFGQIRPTTAIRLRRTFLGEDGRLTQLNVSNGGSYVNVKTAQGGTIILCIPGVAFHMPIWGYILIPVGALVLVAGAVMAIVLTVKHKKGQNEPEDVGITAPGSARFSQTAPAGFPAGAVCWLGGRGGAVTVRPESSSETVVGSC